MLDNQTAQLLAFIWRQVEASSTTIDCRGNSISIVVTYELKSLSDGTPLKEAKILRNELMREGYIVFIPKTSLWHKLKSITHEIKDKTIMIVCNVIDQEIVTGLGKPIDIIPLAIPQGLVDRYRELMISGNLLCRNALAHMPSLYRTDILSKLLVERMEDKATNVIKHYTRLNRNWNDTFLFMLFDSIAISNPTNRKLFGALIENIRFGNILSTLKSLMQKEALIFGAAGLLDNIVDPDEYTFSLRREFLTLRKHYRLTMINASAWKMGTGHKNHSIYILCAYLAHIIHKTPNIAEAVINHRDLAHLKAILHANTSPYWQLHNIPGEKSVKGSSSREMSQSKVELMVINFAAPSLIAYHKEKNNYYSGVIEQIIDDYMPNMKPEKNQLVSQWITPTYSPRDSFEAQAVIQASKIYCKNGRCLSCPIGSYILRAECRIKK